MANVDDVISEDSTIDSDLDSGALDDLSESRRGLKNVTSKPEVVKLSPQPSVKRQRKPTTKFLESCVSSDVIKDCKPKVVKKVAAYQASCTGAAQQLATSRIMTLTLKKDRMLMKDWLITIAGSNLVKNVHWYDNECTMIRIPWKHGSRSGWTHEDCQLYRIWAEYTGKYCSGDEDEPKRWKANFRCALNSLPDVEEVKQLSQSRGTDPYKVYKLCPAKPRKGPCTKRTRKPRHNKAVEHSSPTQQSIQGQRCARKLHVAVNSSSSSSCVLVDYGARTSHQTSPAAQLTMPTDQAVATPVLPLPVASLQMATKNSPTSVKSSATDESLDTSSLMMSSYSDVIPLTVEEMSCDDDSDCDHDDIDPSLYTFSTVGDVIHTSLQSSRQTRSNRSTISESSSGYSSDRFGSPSLDPLLDQSFEPFDANEWFVNDESEENFSVLSQLYSYPEMDPEETHGYAIGLQPRVAPNFIFPLPGRIF